MTAERGLRGALTFMGFIISIVAVIYFAVEYIPDISELGQLLALLLLAVFFGFLGVYLQTTEVGRPFFEGARLRWLRPMVVLVLLAILSGFLAEIRFITIDGVPVPVKVFGSLLVGVALIVVAARYKKSPEAPSPGKAAARTRRRRKT